MLNPPKIRKIIYLVVFLGMSVLPVSAFADVSSFVIIEDLSTYIDTDSVAISYEEDGTACTSTADSARYVVKLAADDSTVFNIEGLTDPLAAHSFSNTLTWLDWADGEAIPYDVDIYISSTYYVAGIECSAQTLKTSFQISEFIPPPPDTTSTSTVDQTQQNTYNGFIIMLMTMFFVVWSFKKR